MNSFSYSLTFSRVNGIYGYVAAFGKVYTTYVAGTGRRVFRVYETPT